MLTAGALRNLYLATGSIGCHAVWLSGNLPSGGGYQPVGLNGTDIFDSDNFHDPSSNNSRVIIPAGLTGLYLILGNYYGPNENHYTLIKKNGTTNNPNYGVSGDDGISSTWSIQYLNGGDYVELGVNVASSLTINAASLVVVKLDGARVGSGIGAAIYHNSNQTMSTSGEAALAMDSKLFDTDGFWSSGTNNRFTIPTGLGGKYEISINAHVSNDPSGGYTIARKNGSSVILAPFFIYSSNLTGGSSSGSNTVELAAGEYIEFKQLAASGATITGGTTWAPFATIMRIDSKPAGDVGKGTSFPSGPVTNDHFVRTDLGNIEFYYDGTRWLCICPHNLNIPWDTDLPISAVVAGGRITHPGRSIGLGIYAKDFWSDTYVVTTNDGTKYWTITLDNPAGGSLVTLSTQSNAPDAVVTETIAVNTVFATSVAWFTITLIRVGSTPGNIYPPTSLSYRYTAT